jgi:hypothetical protein
LALQIITLISGRKSDAELCDVLKGNYEGRIKAIQQLIQKAKKDEMRFGDIRQTFIERPMEDEDVNMKLSLSVYK